MFPLLRRAVRAAAGGDLGRRSGRAGPGRRLRFFVVAFALLLVFTFVGGTQPHYPVFLLPLPFAAGIVAMERHLGRVWAALFALNAVVSAFIGLPLLAVGTVGSTPVPGINPIVGDSVGWPAYVRQVTDVYDALPDRDHAAVFTSNYGEAGAVHHYAPGRPGLQRAERALRPGSTARLGHDRGGRRRPVRRGPRGCSTAAGSAPVSTTGSTSTTRSRACRSRVCTGPAAGWDVLWPRLHHLD